MTDLTARLKALVEAEKEALLVGDLQRIEELMAEKSELAEALNDSPPQVSELAPLRAALARNQELFDKALEGVQSVIARVSAMHQVRKSLDTYDAQGQRNSVAGAASAVNRLEKRA